MYWRGFLTVVAIIGLLAIGITLYARLTARTTAGETTMPPDWPVKEVTLPATATDIYFNHDLRQPGDTLLEIGRQLPSRFGDSHPYTGPWQIRFNDPGPVSAVFDHIEQPLLAAGYVKGTGREESQIATVGITDRSYTSADGKVDLQIRYWASALPNPGGGTPQHWEVWIYKR
jgi:hypothetical protein